MAATKRNAMLIEETRSRIQTTQLLNRLTNHGLGKNKMSNTQVTAALGVLKKSLPDLAAVELTGKAGGPLVITWDKAIDA